MTATQFDGAVTAALAILDDWNSFLSGLVAIAGPDNLKFELSTSIPNVAPPITIDELGQKLSGTVTLIQEFSKIETTVLIPDATTMELLARVSAARATVEKLLGQVDAFEEGGNALSLNPDALLASNAQGVQLDVGAGLTELYPLIQSLLISAYQVRGMAGLSGKGGLALELTHMQAARSAQRKAIGDFKRLSKVLEAQRKELEELVASAKAAAERITVVETQTSEEVARVSESKQRADELIAAAIVSEQAANKVKESVDAYSKTFAAFQRDLDARNVAFEVGKSAFQDFLLESEERRDALLLDQTTRSNDLSKDIKAKEDEIDRLLTRSRAVLGEATVSGLSDSFAKEMTEAGKQLGWIQILFFVSVGLLLVGAAIVLDAFPWASGAIHIAKIEAPTNGDSLAVGVYLLANFLRTLTFLLAPFVLIIYAARRYTELFRMKAHYTYKYTVAASLPGFKLEAPTYAEAITASAFKELLFNPGDSVGKPEEESPDKQGNTFVQRLIEPVVKKAMDKMGEVGN